MLRKKRVTRNRFHKQHDMFRKALGRIPVALKPQRYLSCGRILAKEGDSKTSKHLEFLSKFYTPELLQSIRITESLVSPSEYFDIKKKGPAALSKSAPEDSSFDYSKTDPKWDEPILYPNQAADHTAYPKIPQIQGADRTDLKLRFVKAPEVKKLRKRLGPSREDLYERLQILTGMEAKYMKSLYVRPILLKRVSCQTRKGKIPNFYCMTVVGDQNGMVGLGEGKSRSGMRTAMMKALWNAVKNLQPIPRYENRTIIGDIDYKYHAVKLFIKSAPSGFGLRVNPNLFEVCQAAGIKDLRGKVLKSRNPMNTVKGFIEALTKQTSLEDLAAGRGKKIVDLRKVYYSA